MSRLNEKAIAWPAGVVPSLRLFAVFGAVVALVGAAVDPRAIGANLLLAGWYAAGIGLGALFFVAVHAAAGARWTAALDRVPVSLAPLVPFGAIVVLLAMIGAGSQIYPWMREPVGDPGSFKSLWLTPSFVILRALGYAAAWIAFARAFSRREATRRLSAGFLVVFGATVSLASIDWIMSLEPHWYSTMAGVYQFAGLFLSALAVIAILAILLAERGDLPRFGPSQLHDLGKLLFAFSTFWMYIWFSQAMLIWYGNIPEEAIHYTARLRGDWTTLFVLSPLLNWVIPFFVLLSKRAKRNPKIVLRVALILLVGRWGDLYVEIMPSLAPAGPRISGWDAAIGFGTLSLGALLVLRALERRPREGLVVELPRTVVNEEQAAAG